MLLCNATEAWAPGQMTPFCSRCEAKRPYCHFCAGKAWATPPVWADEEGRSEDGGGLDIHPTMRTCAASSVTSTATGDKLLR